MDKIGKYEIVRVLGRGGMGTVYEAYDPLINRKVALKTMIPELAANPDLKARFLREAQAAGGLRHRNIVTVYELADSDDRPFIAMEMVEGADLEQIIRDQRKLSIEWKIDVLRQICDGLGAAHRAGIVHRDVKPANVKVTPEGEVKIMDFGIAHLQSSKLTRDGLVLGTVHYTSPEQLQGGKLDNRSDIFAVGAIAYELIANRKPFTADSLTGVMYKLTHEPADAEGLPKTDYSPGLEAIILKALATRPEDRYQSLSEMHDDLAKLVQEMASKLMGGDVGQTGSAQTELRTELDQARAEGQLQRAWALCQKLKEQAPDDVAVSRVCAEIQAEIQEREVEQLVATAVAYADDGDVELAGKIMAKIERLAPESPRLADLRKRLEAERKRAAAERGRVEAERHTAAARELLVEGKLDEARAAAEEALRLDPGHAQARQIRDQTARILESRQEDPPRPEAPPEAPSPGMPGPSPTPAEPPRRPSPPPPAPPPLPPPLPPPASPAARAPASPAREPVPGQKPLPPLPHLPSVGTTAAAAVPPSAPPVPTADPAGTGSPSPSVEERPAGSPAPAPSPGPRAERPGAEADVLASAALDHFVLNENEKARKAAERALAIDPSHKGARDLLTLLGSLR